MEHDEARRTKQELAGFIRDLLARRVTTTSAPAVPGVALGLAPQADGGFAVAMRYRLGVPTARMVARRVVEELGPAVDVRRTGRISAIPGRDVAARSAARGARPPVATALALGETGRARPLRPGVSVAHIDVTAGTLGAFVRVSGRVHALSNYHVLVGSTAGALGDAVLQPGPADGGRDPADRVGDLAGFVPLQRNGRFRVDAAVALLVDQEVDPTFEGCSVTTHAPVTGAWVVQKVGRTTGLTRGRVTAIELDDVVVGYGEELGELAFDGQIEVEGLDGAPFSRGGDSGSLVYRADAPVAVGLLFAGSESGGENGKGLTYLNPAADVLAALGAELVG